MSLARIISCSVVTIVTATACGGHLPVPPEWVRVGGRNDGKFVEPWNEYPSGLRTAAHRCQQKLYNDAKAARRAYKYGTAMTVAGGSVAVTGGATSAIIGATIANDSEQAKAAAVTSAIIGAAAGLVTILSKVGQPVETPAKKFGLRDTHWTAANTAMGEYPDRAKDTSSPVYRYVVAEFTACASEDASGATSTSSFDELMTNAERGSKDTQLLEAQLTNETRDKNVLSEQVRSKDTRIGDLSKQVESNLVDIGKKDTEIAKLTGEKDVERLKRELLESEKKRLEMENTLFVEEKARLVLERNAAEKSAKDHERRIKCLQMALDGKPLGTECTPAAVTDTVPVPQ